MNVQLLPGESLTADKKRIVCTPTSLLQRTNRFEASVAPNGGSGAIVDNGQTQFELPQSDLLESLMLQIQATITTNGGTYTSAAFNGWPNPVPFGMIKRITLSANGGAVNLFSLSGWGLYLYLRSRYDFDPFKSNTTDKYCTNSQRLVGSVNPSSQTRAFNGGAVAASTTYSFNMTIPLPIAFNKAGELALLRLQNNSKFVLTIEWANCIQSLGAAGGNSDLITQTTVVGAGYTLSGTARLLAKYIKWLPTDIFEYSAQYNNLKAVQEQVYPLQNGSNAFQLVRNDWYTWIMAEVYNNGAPIGDADISNLSLKHSNLEVMSQADRYTHIADRWYMHHGSWPVDGTIEYDFRRRAGIPDRFDTLDAINDRAIQNLTLGFDVSGTLALTGVYGTRIITEALVDAA